MRGPSGEKASLLVFITKDLTPWAPGRMEPATEFSDGAAAVRIYEHGAMRPGAVVLGPSGETLAEVREAVMLKNFSEGMAPAHKSPGWGYIDNSGRWTVPPKFTNAEPFSEGLARIQSGQHWGFIDATGRRHPRATTGRRFSGAGSRLRRRENERLRVCRQDREIIPMRYREASVFASGTALVKVDDRQYKYIGKTGRDVWGGLRPIGSDGPPVAREDCADSTRHPHGRARFRGAMKRHRPEWLASIGAMKPKINLRRSGCDFAAASTKAGFPSEAADGQDFAMFARDLAGAVPQTSGRDAGVRTTARPGFAGP